MAPQVRLGAAVVAAIAFVGAGGAILVGRPWQLPQVDVETPLEWAHEGPLRWAVKNGVALGFGGGTRIGFPIFYAVPIASFLAGDVVAGLMLYGLYGMTRGVIPAGVIWATRRSHMDTRQWAESCVAKRPRVARWAAAALVVEATAVAVCLL